MSAPLLQEGHSVDLLQGGAEFFPALLQAVDASVNEVRLETYIFSFDAAGQAIAEALERAARRGVQVYLLMDAIGTGTVPVGWAQRFTQAGLHWRLFSPLGPWGLLPSVGWRRLHRKLCVVDARIAFCGGINILDDYFDPSHGAQESPRFDFAVRVQGPLVAEMLQTMRSLWQRLHIARQLEQLDFKDARLSWKHARQALRASKQQSTAAARPQLSGIHAMLLLRDNLRNRNRIERAYRKAIATARHEVLIANAYFLPGGKLRRALVHAARRGVRVRLLLQGRYEYFMQYHGARSVLGALLAAGIEIHEYAAGFLHAKVAVVDGLWATVGSSNLDPLSLLLAREANVVVSDVGFAQDLRARLEQAMASQGVVLDTQSFANRPWHQRLLDRLAFAVMRLALYLTGRSY